MTARPRVQFVTYEASRTGSPLLLLRFLRWLRDEGSLDLDLLCWRGGPLLDEFAAAAPTRALAPLGRRTAVETLAVGAGEVGLGAVGRRLETARLAVALRSRPVPDLVYLNGVPSFIALPNLGLGADVPVVGHVHELELALSRSLPAGHAHLLGRADHYVAVSDAVAQNLVANHGIDPEVVTVVHGFVDERRAPSVDEPGALRARLGIPAEAPVVGAMGDLIWRKGPDLFVQLAAAVSRVRPPGSVAVHFVWVGGSPTGATGQEVAHDLASTGLSDRVHLVGEQPHPGDWHAMFDVFALTSREDPFPLVVLEAGQAGVPVVAFEQGGVPEMVLPAEPVARPAGVLVSPLDVAAMAEAVALLLDDPARALDMGVTGHERVQERHVTPVVAPHLLEIIEALL